MGRPEKSHSLAKRRYSGQLYIKEAIAWGQRKRRQRKQPHIRERNNVGRIDIKRTNNMVAIIIALTIIVVLGRYAIAKGQALERKKNE